MRNGTLGPLPAKSTLHAVHQPFGQHGLPHGHCPQLLPEGGEAPPRAEPGLSVGSHPGGGILLLNGHLLLAPHSNNTCLSFQLGSMPSASLRWHQALFMLEFFLPLALILFAISIGLTIKRRRLAGQPSPRRAVSVLAVVVAIYTTCFLPSVIFGMASMVAFRLHACHTLNICTQLFHGCLAFTYFNSVLDPVLYCFSSPNFLRQVRALLCLTQGRQDPARGESSYQPSAQCREASRRVEASGKPQVRSRWKPHWNKDGGSQGQGATAVPQE